MTSSNRVGRLLITGSRDWNDRAVMRSALQAAWHELKGRGFDEIVLVQGLRAAPTPSLPTYGLR